MTDMPSIVSERSGNNAMTTLTQQPKNQLVSQLDEARTLGNLAQVPALAAKIQQDAPEYQGEYNEEAKAKPELLDQPDERC